MFSYRGFFNAMETEYSYSVCITRTNKLKVIKFSFTQCINRNLRYSMCCLLVIKKLLKQQSIHTTRTFNLFQQHLKCCLPVKFVLCNFCMIKGDGSFVHQRAEKTLVQLHFDGVKGLSFLVARIYILFWCAIKSIQFEAPSQSEWTSLNLHEILNPDWPKVIDFLANFQQKKRKNLP